MYLIVVLMCTIFPPWPCKTVDGKSIPSDKAVEFEICEIYSTVNKHWKCVLVVEGYLFL
jgi:hypothetical protein